MTLMRKKKDFALISLVFIVVFLIKKVQGSGCKIVPLMDRRRSQFLRNHVIDTLTVANELQCSIECYNNDICQAYNYNKRTHECQILSSTAIQHRGDLVQDSTGDWVYAGTKNDCKPGWCSSSDKFCKANFITGGHTCLDNCQLTGSCVTSATATVADTGSSSTATNTITTVTPSTPTSPATTTATTSLLNTTPAAPTSTTSPMPSSVASTVTPSTAHTATPTTLVAVSSSVSTGSGTCPDTWTKKESGCYKVFSEGKTRAGAYSVCISNGGKLINLRDKEKSFIDNLPGITGTEYHVGASKWSSIMGWRWVDGNPVSSPWTVLAGSNENYGIIKQWEPAKEIYGTDYNGAKAFICEINL